jgi:methionyl aminopeptidase
MEYKKFYTDTAVTVAVGQAGSLANRLMEITSKSLSKAVSAAKPGNRIGDISYAIQTTSEGAGFSVVRDMVGHGVGYAVHEDPAVPCYGQKNTGIELVPGMVLAIEPMVCQGRPEVYFDEDGWGIRTVDGGLSAHFEHTIAITEHGCRVLT